MTLKPAYTEFFKVYATNQIYLDILDQFNTALWAELTRREELFSMIMAKFAYWEVWTTDKNEFINSISIIFDRYQRYYGELLNAYETQINFLDGDKVTTDYESHTTNTPRAQYETIDYDLPRSSASIDRPTTKTTNGGVTGTDKSDIEGSSTKKGGNVIDLKRKYMELIRNLLEEFAEKFRPCFIELFDGCFMED